MKTMTTNYLNSTIACLSVFITLVLTIKSFYTVEPLNFIFIFGISTWFIRANIKNYHMNTLVKVSLFLVLVMSYFVIYGSVLFIIPSDLSQFESKLALSVSFCAYDFFVSFISMLVIAPLLISIFSKTSKVLSVLISLPTIFFSQPFNFSTSQKMFFTFGLLVSKIIGVILATHILYFFFNLLIDHIKMQQSTQTP
ncbi:MAG: hypothetical protein ACI8ZB_004456 [Desulforhopalus sp.]|jgi:hypothetical protein